MNCTCCGAEVRANECECRFCGEPASIQERYVPKTKRTTVHMDVQESEAVRPDHIYTDARSARPEHIYVEHHYVREKSDKNRLVLLLLCLFLGRWGAHKFYLGKVGSGVAYLITRGWFCIGWLADLFSIALGDPRDNEGRPIKW